MVRSGPQGHGTLLNQTYTKADILFSTHFYSRQVVLQQKNTTPGSEEQGVEKYSKTEAAAKGARCLCDSRALGVRSSLSPF